MAPDPDVDPCEIHFSDYRETAGCQLPYRLQVRHGDRVFLELELREIRLPNREKPEA